MYPNIPPYYSSFQQPQPSAPPFNPCPTRAMHTETVALLKKAHDILEMTAGKQTSAPSTHHSFMPLGGRTGGQFTLPTLNFDFSDKSWKMFNRGDVHHHYHDGKEAERKKEDNEQAVRVLLGFIGLVAASATAFFIGKAVAQGEEKEENKDSFNYLAMRWTAHQHLYQPEYQSAVNGMIYRTQSLLERNQTDRMHHIALLTLGFVAGGTAITAALVGSNALMVTAIGLGTIGCTATLFKVGYAYFSARDQNDRKIIEDNLAYLHQQAVAIAD